MECGRSLDVRTGRVVPHGVGMVRGKTMLQAGANSKRAIDRATTLRATTVTFTDAKDGLLGLHLAPALQILSDKDEKFTDDKGNVHIMKAGIDHVPNGTYLTSAGKRGNNAWSTRGIRQAGSRFGQRITIIDHHLASRHRPAAPGLQ